MAVALLDTNVLVYAAYKDSRHHSAAAKLVDRGLRRSSEFCIAPQNLVEFAAVVSRARLVEKPMPSAELLRMTELLYRSRRLAKIYPRRGTVARTMQQGAALGISGPAWYDLFLAMTMRDADVESIVTDNVDDFRRIPFIKVQSIEQSA